MKDLVIHNKGSNKLWYYCKEYTRHYTLCNTKVEVGIPHYLSPSSYCPVSYHHLPLGNLCVTFMHPLKAPIWWKMIILSTHIHVHNGNQTRIASYQCSWGKTESRPFPTRCLLFFIGMLLPTHFLIFFIGKWIMVLVSHPIACFCFSEKPRPRKKTCLQH